MADETHPAPPAPPSRVYVQDGRDRQFLLRVILWTCVLSIAWTIFVIVGPIDSWFPEATIQAREVDDLFKFMLATGGIIFILVQVAIVAFALRYRRRKNEPEDALGAQTHGNTTLEVAWTAAPSVLLVVLMILTMRVWTDEHTAGKNELRLAVQGYQWGFYFGLPQYGIGFDKTLPTIEIPVNRPVYVDETAQDVIHSFWVPEFRIKQDMVPGIHTNERFTPDRIGTYRVICTEFCGTQHSAMHTTIKVVSQSEFYNFVRKNGGKNVPTSQQTAAVVRQ